jgi:hypothetical protein
MRKSLRGANCYSAASIVGTVSGLLPASAAPASINYRARHRNSQWALVTRKIALAPLRRSMGGAALGAKAAFHVHGCRTTGAWG